MRHAGQAVGRLVARGDAIGGRAGAPDGAGHRTGGHRQRGDQDTRAVADARMVTPFASPRLGRLGGGFALPHLPAGFCIATAHQPALGVGGERLGIQLAEDMGFGLTVRIVAVEPGRTLVGRESDVVQDTPDTRAAERVGVQSVAQGGDDGISCPPGAGALLVVRQRTGHRDDLDTRGGGNRARTP